jgi:hypothetical protein
MNQKNRSTVAVVLAASVLFGIYSVIIPSIQKSYAQQPQVFQRYQDPIAPYNWHSAGTSQYGLSVTAGAVVTLTVPTKAVCAVVVVNTQVVRRTSDGSSPTGTVGVLQAVAQPALYDCGPIRSYKYIATAAGSATLDVEYFY